MKILYLLIPLLFLSSCDVESGDISRFLNTNNDISVGIILGAIIGFIGQLLTYHFIEKGKLCKEREFSFRKEYYFVLQGNAQIILSRIEQDYSDIIQCIPYQSLYHKEHKHIEVSDNEIKSIVRIYFSELFDKYDVFSVHHGNLLLFINQGEFNNYELPSEEFNDELKAFETSKNTFELELHDLISRKQPINL